MSHRKNPIPTPVRGIVSHIAIHDGDVDVYGFHPH